MFERYNQLAAQVENALAMEMKRLDAPDTLLRAMSHSLLAKAKRVRAVVLLLTLEAYGFFWQRGLYPALALEYIHCYSLIHDDLPCMDDDYLRRGRPTNHLIFGEAMAVLAGDALLSEAFALAQRGFLQGAYNGDTLAGVVLELVRSSGATGMVAGQVDDLLLAGEAFSVSESSSNNAALLEKLRQVHLRKTGALLQAPFRLAAIIAGLPAEETKLLSDFGAQFGLVFQIQDDLLDCLGDATLMGKATGRDQRQHKVTYPALLGITQTQAVLRREQDVLEELLDGLQCRHEEMQRLLEVMRGRES